MVAKVTELVVQQQGGLVFSGVSNWNDAVASSAVATAYDLAAARTAMGLAAGQPLFVVFAADGPFWVNFFNAAVIPVANITNGTAAEFSPNQRYLDSSINTISIISAAAQKVSMQFYRP